MRAISVFVACAGLFAGAATPSHAQSEPPGEPLGTIEDCQFVPEPGATPADPGSATLSEALAPCNGVIAPPPVGDPGMTITPPPVGETPVIHPDDVPPQSADGE